MRGDWRGVDPASLEAGVQVESPCLGPDIRVQLCVSSGFDEDPSSNPEESGHQRDLVPSESCG